MILTQQRHNNDADQVIWFSLLSTLTFTHSNVFTYYTFYFFKKASVIDVFVKIDNKRSSHEACNFIRKETQAQEFFCEFFEKFLRTQFLQNTSGVCFCNRFYSLTIFAKISYLRCFTGLLTLFFMGEGEFYAAKIFLLILKNHATIFQGTKFSFEGFLKILGQQHAYININDNFVR